MKRILTKTSIGAVAFLGMLSWNVNAQTACGDIEYNAEILENYPELSEACQEVIEHDGNMYTKVYARIGRMDRMDRRTVQLVMDDGSLGPRHRVKQRPNFNVTTDDGESIEWEELASNQTISVYIPHDRWAIVHVDEEGSGDVTEYTMVPVSDELPSTASNRYLSLYAGIGALAFASMLWWRRKGRSA